MKFWSKFHTEIWDSVLVEFSFATYDLRRVTKQKRSTAKVLIWSCFLPVESCINRGDGRPDVAAKLNPNPSPSCAVLI